MLGIVQLNRDSIIDAAVSILDDYGLSDMTMRRVARQLDVAPGALYWHFANKQELIDATARRILAPLLAPAEGGVDKRAPLSVAETCARLRALLIGTRDGAEVVSAALSNPELRADLEALMSAATESPDATGSFTLLHFVVGAVLAEQTQRQLHELTGTPEEFADAEERFRDGVAVINSGLLALGRIR